MDYALIVGMSLLVAFWVWVFRTGAKRAPSISPPVAPVLPLPTLHFDVQGAVGAARQTSLQRTIIKLGSDPKAHLRLDGAGVYRLHAVIEVSRGPSAFLIDLGTPGGTRLNGAKIHRAELAHGDVIELGGLKITLGIDKPAVAARVQDAA